MQGVDLKLAWFVLMLKNKLFIVRSLRSASCFGVPIAIWGILESLYVSLLRLTRSSSKSNSFILAVSKCFDCSGLLVITATCAMVVEPLMNCKAYVGLPWASKSFIAKHLPINLSGRCGQHHASCCNIATLQLTIKAWVLLDTSTGFFRAGHRVVMIQCKSGAYCIH